MKFPHKCYCYGEEYVFVTFTLWTDERREWEETSSLARPAMSIHGLKYSGSSTFTDTREIQRHSPSRVYEFSANNVTNCRFVCQLKTAGCPITQLKISTNLHLYEIHSYTGSWWWRKRPWAVETSVRNCHLNKSVRKPFYPLGIFTQSLPCRILLDQNQYIVSSPQVYLCLFIST